MLSWSYPWHFGVSPRIEPTRAELPKEHFLAKSLQSRTNKLKNTAFDRVKISINLFLSDY
jgi:hypothetical protein